MAWVTVDGWVDGWNKIALKREMRIGLVFLLYRDFILVCVCV
jgi:hypothetical protein